MPETLLIPSVDLRIGSLEEYNRSKRTGVYARLGRPRQVPVVTLSREYGCTGYPVAERLRELLMAGTGEEWVVIDRAILDEVARRNDLSVEILRTLGERHRILDELLSNFSPRWKSARDCFTLIARHVIALAEQGNVIILELGGATITGHSHGACHVRLYGSEEFKIATLAGRLGLGPREAAAIMHRQQKLRDGFAREFLDRDDHDPTLYDLLFNNDRSSAEEIARVIARFVLDREGDGPDERAESGRGGGASAAAAAQQVLPP